MDKTTEQVLKLIQSQHLLRTILIRLCYTMIVGGFLIYAFYGFSKSNAIKLVQKHAENMKEYHTEKIMTNPRIKLQHDNNDVYSIQAKKAFHENDQEVILYDVFAEGAIGKITSGELKISDEGNHLVFTKNPVLILNQTK